MRSITTTRRCGRRGECIIAMLIIGVVLILIIAMIQKAIKERPAPIVREVPVTVYVSEKPASDDTEGLIVPAWYKARYTKTVDGGLRNPLFLWMLGLGILTTAVVAGSKAWAAKNSDDAAAAAFGIGLGVPAAVGAAGFVGMAVSYITVAILRPTGSVPPSFVYFCTLVVTVLTLVFFLTSQFAGRRDEGKELKTTKRILLAVLKALAVTAFTALAKAVGDATGALLGGIVVALLAALFNPKAEAPKDPAQIKE